MNLLRRLYRQFPVVRELRKLEASVQSFVPRLLNSRRVNQETALMLLLQQERYRDPKRLAQSEHQVFSQNGEDGIVAEIFARIGTLHRNFLEIGAGDGLENNSAFLLAQGFTGVWVEGSPLRAAAIRQLFAEPLQASRLRLIESVVTRENIAGLLERASCPKELDLVSIDIDQNTYWAWEGLPQLNARLIVVEYNATMPAWFDWKVAYRGDRGWDGSFNFGASLKAYENLGRLRGYRLVGCDLTGTNAFFVREDLCGDSFKEPFTAEEHYEPARYWLLRQNAHRRSADVVNCTFATESESGSGSR